MVLVLQAEAEVDWPITGSRLHIRSFGNCIGWEPQSGSSSSSSSLFSCTVSARDGTVLPRRWAPVPGRFWGPETAVLHFIIADYLSHTAVCCRWLGLPCCHRSHLDQSASTRHVHTLCACFPRTSEGFPPQAFLFLNLLPQLCSAGTVTVVIFGHLNRFLLTYPFYVVFFAFAS